jgi:hypothetical protein
VKLIEKRRVGARIRQRYDAPRPPLAYPLEHKSPTQLH